MREDRLDRSILFGASFLLLAPGAFWGLPAGKSVAGALVILDGGLPYRDFWTMYAPGQFYAVAALFWLFGRELLVQALAACLVVAGATAAFFTLLKRLGASRRQALLLSAVFALMFWSNGPELTDYEPALLFILLALDRAVRYLDDGGGRHLRWAGVWFGLAAWFKHDIAAYAAIGTTASLFISSLAARGPRPGPSLTPLRATVTMAAAAGAAAAPLAIWTMATAATGAWNDLLVFPATVFGQTRGEAFPPLLPNLEPVFLWMADVTHVRRALAVVDSLAPWAMLNAAQVMWLGGVGALLFAWRQGDRTSLARVALFLACAPFFWAAAHIQQNTHPYTLAVLSAGIGVVAWNLPGAGARWTTWTRRALVAIALVHAGGMLARAAAEAAAVYYEWEGSRRLDLAGFRGIRVPERQHRVFQPLGALLRSTTAEREPIYAGLVRHDAIVASNTLLYAIAGRPACCGITELHAGVADRRAVQSDIIMDLERRRVRAIALWDFGWPEEDLEARKRRVAAAVPDAGSTLLDRYLAEHFRVVAAYGEYQVLWRRDAPFPAQQVAAPRSE